MNARVDISALGSDGAKFDGQWITTQTSVAEEAALGVGRWV